MAITQGGPGFASENLNIYTFQTGLFYFRIGYASSLIVSLFVIGVRKFGHPGQSAKEVC